MQIILRVASIAFFCVWLLGLVFVVMQGGPNLGMGLGIYFIFFTPVMVMLFGVVLGIIYVSHYVAVKSKLISTPGGVQPGVVSQHDIPVTSAPEQQEMPKIVDSRLKSRIFVIVRFLKKIFLGCLVMSIVTIPIVNTFDFYDLPLFMRFFVDSFYGGSEIFFVLFFIFYLIEREMAGKA